MQMFKVSRIGTKFAFEPMEQVPGPDCPRGELMIGSHGPELVITKGNPRFQAALEQQGWSMLAMKESDAADLILARNLNSTNNPMAASGGHSMEHAFTEQHKQKLKELKERQDEEREQPPTQP